VWSDRPTSLYVQEIDIDKSAQKIAKGPGLKGMMNNLSAKIGYLPSIEFEEALTLTSVA